MSTPADGDTKPADDPCERVTRTVAALVAMRGGHYGPLLDDVAALVGRVRTAEAERDALEENYERLRDQSGDRIAALQDRFAAVTAENARLAEALRPFALLGSDNPVADPRVAIRFTESVWEGLPAVEPTMADAFRAAELLAARGTPAGGEGK